MRGVPLGGREGGRLGKSTAEMHSFVPRIEERGGVGGGEHERPRHSRVFNHDTYLVEEVRKTMPIKLISCQNGIQTCMLNDIS